LTRRSEPIAPSICIVKPVAWPETWAKYATPARGTSTLRQVESKSFGSMWTARLRLSAIAPVVAGLSGARNDRRVHWVARAVCAGGVVILDPSPMYLMEHVLMPKINKRRAALRRAITRKSRHEGKPQASPVPVRRPKRVGV
jgi:hypothetical protein